jgi:hypothetical protein
MKSFKFFIIRSIGLSEKEINTTLNQLEVEEELGKIILRVFNSRRREVEKILKENSSKLSEKVLMDFDWKISVRNNFNKDNTIK